MDQKTARLDNIPCVRNAAVVSLHQHRPLAVCATVNWNKEMKMRELKLEFLMLTHAALWQLKNLRRIAVKVETKVNR